jgi:hypothetical protein
MPHGASQSANSLPLMKLHFAIMEHKDVYAAWIGKDSNEAQLSGN